MQFNIIRRGNFGKEAAWAKLDAAWANADDEISDGSYGLDSSKPEDKKMIE